MILCPCCARHIRVSARCPFCALVVATVCAVVVASCGGNNRPPAMYGGPPEPQPAAKWTTKLDHDIEDLVATFVVKGTGYGCTVKSRATDEAVLACAEGDISVVKRELEVTISCDTLSRSKCETLFRTIIEAK